MCHFESVLKFSAFQSRIISAIWSIVSRTNCPSKVSSGASYSCRYGPSNSPSNSIDTTSRGARPRLFTACGSAPESSNSCTSLSTTEKARLMQSGARGVVSQLGILTSTSQDVCHLCLANNSLPGQQALRRHTSNVKLRRRTQIGWWMMDMKMAISLWTMAYPRSVGPKVLVRGTQTGSTREIPSGADSEKCEESLQVLSSKRSC